MLPPFFYCLCHILRLSRFPYRKKALHVARLVVGLSLIDSVGAAGKGVIEDIDTADIHGIARSLKRDGVPAFG